MVIEQKDEVDEIGSLAEKTRTGVHKSLGIKKADYDFKSKLS